MKCVSKNELIVENWNLKHPIGTLVKLRKDDGTTSISKRRAPKPTFATLAIRSGFLFENVSGYYLLECADAL